MLQIPFWVRDRGPRTPRHTHRHALCAVTLLLVSMTATGAWAQSQPQQETIQPRPPAAKYLQTSGRKKLEVVYKQSGERQLRLDLYFPDPPQSKPCPVVVFTHGGGWATGSRYKAAGGPFAEVFTRLIRQGFAVAPVTYRLCKKGSNVTMRDCVIDCKDAVRFLAKKSESLGIDRNRMCVMGDSAGGHLAQMLLLTPPGKFTGDPALATVSYRMVAGVSWYGPCDFENTQLFNHDDRAGFRDRFASRILGADLKASDRLQRYREVSPVNFLQSDSPPLLMIQGDQDTTIPVKHAYHMQRKADALGAPVEIMIIKNSGHNWRKVEADIEPSREVIVKRTVQFLTEQARRPE